MNEEGLFTIEYRHLAIVLVVFLLGAALAIGIMVTPYVRGQPLLLTRDNLAVKDYLDQYSTRVATAEKERAALAALLTPSRPGANVSSVFDASQRARDAQANLDALARDVDRARVPSGLAPLDDALRVALAADLNLADMTLTFVGRADEASRTDALASSDDTATKLAAARQALTDVER